MRLTEHFVATELFPLDHMVHVKVLVFRLRAISHRMMCFGFEKFVNSYEPRELVMMGALMQPPQQNALLLEAHKRADRDLREWIEKHSPELFSLKVAAHV